MNDVTQVNRAALALYLDDQPDSQTGHEHARRAWLDGRVPERDKARYRRAAMTVLGSLEDAPPATAADPSRMAAIAHEMSVDLSRLRNERDDLNRRVEDLTRDLDEARTELADFATERQADGKLIEADRKLIGTLRDDVHRLTGERDTVRRDLTQACAERDERLTLAESSQLAKLVDEARAERDTALAEITTLRTALDHTIQAATLPSDPGRIDAGYVAATRARGVRWYQMPDGRAICDDTPPAGAVPMYVRAGEHREPR